MPMQCWQTVASHVLQKLKIRGTGYNKAYTLASQTPVAREAAQMDASTVWIVKTMFLFIF